MKKIAIILLFICAGVQAEAEKEYKIKEKLISYSSKIVPIIKIVGELLALQQTIYSDSFRRKDNVHTFREDIKALILYYVGNFTVFFQIEDSSYLSTTGFSYKEIFTLYLGCYFIFSGIKKFNKDSTIEKIEDYKIDKQRTAKIVNYLTQIKTVFVSTVNIALGLYWLQKNGKHLFIKLTNSHEGNADKTFFIYAGQFILGQYLIQDGVTNLVKLHLKSKKAKKQADKEKLKIQESVSLAV